MMGQLVVEPVGVLQRASRTVASGDLNTRITLLQTDEFGYGCGATGEAALTENLWTSRWSTSRPADPPTQSKPRRD